MATVKGTKVVTGEVRLSYAHLLEPYSHKEGDKAKYSTVIIIPKSDTETVEAIKRAQQAALQEGITGKFGGRKPHNLKLTLKDGDVDADTERNPEYANSYYMNISSFTRPGVVDRSLKPLDTPDRVYSGVYARVSMNAYPYNSNGSKGITFGLNNVQILRDGGTFGAVSRPENDFEVLPPLDPEDDTEVSEFI